MVINDGNGLRLKVVGALFDTEARKKDADIKERRAAQTYLAGKPERI